MKIYIVSGEKSGDLHGANLVKEMISKDPELQLRGFGGDKMIEEGVEVVKHINELSFMGFTEVIKNLSTINRNLKFCKKDISDFNPDSIILIDFPGFNLKIAKYAKQKGIKVFYYISPKVWAWNKSRVELIKKYVDELIVIFPFEVEYFNKIGVKVNYFGNPLSDEIKKEIPPLSISTNKKIIALLPGSRKQEIERNLPIMLSVILDFPEYQFVIASTNSMFTLCTELSENTDVKMVKEQTYSVLKNSEIALVTSGTATLETALFNIPQLVCYRTDFLTYNLAKLFVKTKWISLVNIIMDKEVVSEFIQGAMTKENLTKEMNYLLSENGNSLLLTHYKELDLILKSDNVSEKISGFILKSI